MDGTEQLYWIDIGYACFGIVAKDGTVIDAAPIVRWMIGQSLANIKPWLLKRKAKGILVE